MGRPKINISRDVLEHLYLDERRSAQEIARLYGCNGQTVINRLRDHCIPIRTRGEGTALAKVISPRTDFSNDLIEKAYLIGFRIGDLTVDLLNAGGQTIRVSCASTKSDQIDLIKELFGRYGRLVINGPYANGRVFVQCLLNTSFEFLLPKPDSIPKWIDDERLFLSFLAGYVDAEGHIGIASSKAVMILATADHSLLSQIHSRLAGIGIVCPEPRLWLKGGYVNSRGITTRRHIWRLGVYRAESLARLVHLLLPFLRHRKRRADATRVLDFITAR
ncbi:MAG TPA: LAGLIDADG family homing endonuclease [Anaerolineales bacterium]|nr:LAGLIDADG family homing endonuclease [Anaerolineales bacterium]